MPDTNEDCQILRETVARAARERIAPGAAQRDQAGEFDWDVAELCWDLGLLTLTYPPELGGWPAHGTALCTAVEEVAKVCASSALLLIIQAVGSFPIIHGASGDLRDRVVNEIIEKRQLAAYLVTEPGAGSDVAAITTTAKRDGDDWVINGAKCFATNGGVASVYSVLARTSASSGHNGLSFFLVERDRPGVSIGKTEHKLGQRASNTTDVVLEEVRIPSDHLLGVEGQGFVLAMKDFDMSRPAIGAQALGIAQGALREMVEHAMQRKTFGKPIADHQLIQRMIANAATRIEAARGLVYRAAEAFDRGERNTKIASMAKCFASDTAMAVTTDAIQVFGGYGYTTDYAVERMFRDAKLTQIFEGTNQIQRLVIAREVIKEHH